MSAGHIADERAASASRLVVHRAESLSADSRAP